MRAPPAEGGAESSERRSHGQVLQLQRGFFDSHTRITHVPALHASAERAQCERGETGGTGQANSRRRRMWPRLSAATAVLQAGALLHIAHRMCEGLNREQSPGLQQPGQGGGMLAHLAQGGGRSNPNQLTLLTYRALDEYIRL